MGSTVTFFRALTGLSVLVICVGGLRVISLEEDCSQPEIQCTIGSSSCFDFSWLRSFSWTPNGPSSMEVTAGIGMNEMGQRVPVLHINWTISIDSSIQMLQGVEISVLEPSTNMNRCVQFQFNGTFPRQVNRNGQPWQFYYNNFEVSPGHLYFVTVQHLPKQEKINYKEKEFTVPRCNEANMMLTDTCCNLGLCWFPNIRTKYQGNNLTVEFTTRWDAQEYGVRVKTSDALIDEFKRVFFQVSKIQRVEVTFPGIGGYKDIECIFNISVWPYMSPCNNDCMRQYYVPSCPTETPPPPEPVERWYLWPLAVLLTLMLCGSIMLGLRLKVKPPLPSAPGPPIPPPARKKVWLVYSADHRYYTKAVIRLSDFMRSVWGLDVVLDRLHVQEIGIIGPVAWLGRQKDEIERTNGTILILCSRGVQKKWKAMQDVQEQQITLREDREHPIGDLLTAALSLILPDFQTAMAKDCFFVAYFGSISSPADIPSPLKICPIYSLTENLQELYFRIQRQEQHQPHIELTVSYETHVNYKRLVKAIEKCREWQECNLGWFEKECSLIPAEDPEDSEEEEEDVDDKATCKVYPLISYPKTSVCKVEPCILEPNPVRVLDPTIVMETQSTQVEPLLSDIDPSVSVLQPLLQEGTSTAACIQEPQLVGDLNTGLLRQDVSIHSDEVVLSVEQLGEAQARFFQNAIESSYLSPEMEIINIPRSGLVVPILNERHPIIDGEQYHEILLNEHLMTPQVDPSTGLPDRRSVQHVDQGYSTWDSHEMDLKTIELESLKLFLQNAGLPNFEQV
ncbi:interleukin-17 receptor A isoform X2 [Pyxicephalus adspersus]|uniref:interleukin-17 receptor A isoform X2 n=1 Tax=Pyxicephalus adspersus TaxID=30357 RepID=UPI003B5C0189